MFTLEVLDGEQIYDCNVCDNGFDSEDEIKKHIKEDHKEIIVEISKNMENIGKAELNDETKLYIG